MVEQTGTPMQILWNWTILLKQQTRHTQDLVRQLHKMDEEKAVLYMWEHMQLDSEIND